MKVFGFSPGVQSSNVSGPSPSLFPFVHNPNFQRSTSFFSNLRIAHRTQRHPNKISHPHLRNPVTSRASHHTVPHPPHILTSPYVQPTPAMCPYIPQTNPIGKWLRHYTPLIRNARFHENAPSLGVVRTVLACLWIKCRRPPLPPLTSVLSPAVHTTLS